MTTHLFSDSIVESSEKRSRLSDIRRDFPALASEHDQPLTYLDSAATSFMPTRVLEAMQHFECTSRANVHRGMYRIAEQATQLYETSRMRVATWIHASADEIVFTKNATGALNGLASVLVKRLRPGDEILLSVAEHHANLVPWLLAAKEKKLVIRWIPLLADGGLDFFVAKELMSERTKIISVTAVSNVLGTIYPVEAIARMAHSVGAVCLIDASQFVPHARLDVEKWDADFVVFSAHKMFGPMGVGVLYGKKAILKHVDPWETGGGMVQEVTRQRVIWQDPPYRFEAGTPNITGVIGFGATLEYLGSLNLEALWQEERRLLGKTMEALQNMKGIQLYGSMDITKRLGVLSFSVQGIHSHDLATILGHRGVCVRGGHHCAQPLMRELGVTDLTRASFALYNHMDDVERLVEGIEYAKRVLQV